MSMKNRLTCCCPVIEADSEAIRLEIFEQLFTDFRNNTPDLHTLVVRKIKDTGYMPLGDNESMTWTDWKSVTKDTTKQCLADQLV